MNHIVIALWGASLGALVATLIIVAILTIPVWAPLWSLSELIRWGVIRHHLSSKIISPE